MTGTLLLFALLLMPDTGMTPKPLDPEKVGLLRTLTPFAGNLGSIHMSPDGRHALVGTRDGAALLYEVNTWTLVRSWDARLAGGQGLAFGPKGHLIAASGREGTIRIWDIKGNMGPEVKTAAVTGAHRISFSPDGARLFSAIVGDTIRIFDLASTRQVRSMRVRGARAMALADNGRRLAASPQDGSLKLWDMDTWKEQTLKGHTLGISSIAFARDGRRILTGGFDGILKVWDPEKEEPEHASAHLGGIIFDISPALDGRHAVFAVGRSVILWDLEHREAAAHLNHHRDNIVALAMHPSGRMFATVGNDRFVKIWGFVKGGMSAVRPQGFCGVSMNMSHDGRGVAVVEILQETPAARAGLQEGDRILSVGGIEVNDPERAAEAIGRFYAGDEVEFLFERDGTRRTVGITLGTRPE